MAVYSVQPVSKAGAELAFEQASGTEAQPDTFFNFSGDVLLHVLNGGSTVLQVTVTATGPCSHGFLHDCIYIIEPGDEEAVGPFPRDRFSNKQNVVSIYYDQPGQAQVAAVRTKED